VTLRADYMEEGNMMKGYFTDYGFMGARPDRALLKVA